MNGTKMTEYAFEIKGKVKVTLSGTDTNLNYELAREMAVEKASVIIDEDWLDDVLVKEYADYESA